MYKLLNYFEHDDGNEQFVAIHLEIMNKVEIARRQCYALMDRLPMTMRTIELLDLLKDWGLLNFAPPLEDC